MQINNNLNVIAISPLKDVEVKSMKSGRFSVASQKHELAIGRVAIDTPEYKAGTKLYLVSEAASQPWNASVMSVGDLRFVLCPKTSIIAFEE